MFRAIRQQLDAPPEFRTRHVRYQAVLALVLFRRELLMRFGQDLAVRYSYNGTGIALCPAESGPYSYQGYLLMMAECGIGGDDLVLQALHLLWRVKFTVINAHTLRERRIGHDLPMDMVDIVLVVNDYQHYAPVGK